MYKQIYKKDTKNKIRFLTIQVLGEPEGELLQISGLLGTDKPILHSKICKGKNIGRSNETTPNEQAIKEANALYKDKLTKGYFDTIEEAEGGNVILPMLAKDYKKESHKIDYNDPVNSQVFVQAKLDGMRCLAHINSPTEVILMSRDGKVINNMMHIETDLMRLATLLNPSRFPHIIDGELYVHGEDFQTNMEYIKKYTPGSTERIKFHIYDRINLGEYYENRRRGLSYIEGLSKGLKLKYLDYVHSYQINSESMLKKAHEAFLKCGYEGTMVRLGRGKYKIAGRSSDLLKYKDFQDLALPILDVIPCRIRTDWGEPIFAWKGATNHRSGKDVMGSNTKMSHEMKKDLLKNKHLYIGKTAEVRFFEYSNTGVPRFPVVHGIRLDK